MVSYLSMRKNKKIERKIALKVALLLAIIVIIFVSMLIALFAYYYGRIHPNVYVLQTNVGSLTREQALSLIQETYVIPDSVTIDVTAGDIHKTQAIFLSSAGFSINYEKTIANAFSVGRKQTLEQSIVAFWQTVTGGTQILPVIEYEEDTVEVLFAGVAEELSEPPVYPSITSEKTVKVTQGLAGYEVSSTQIKEAVIRSISTANNSPITITTSYVDPTLTPQEIESIQLRAEKLLHKSVSIEKENHSITFDGVRLITVIDPKGTYKLDAILALVEEAKSVINRDPQNPVFMVKNERVEEFSPALPGLTIIEDNLIAAIQDALSELESTEVDELAIDTPVSTTPSQFETQDTNNLGIHELIGRGTSQFKGSISSRVHNIALAASRLNGVLIAPGETFSFTDTLGDISVYSGYKQSYVIRDGATVLGDGGGVCQVSTTFFRAALAAGLPIVERHPHSYRVTYYEQDSKPGIDATIYSPSVDIKIVNDTPGHILIQTLTDTDNYTLTFELYGTNDGRIAQIGTPVIHSTTPPPDDLYIDDPSLPAGAVKQIDYKAWGAKVTFDYTVTRGEEILQDKTFSSNYRAWQAKFLRGTGPTN